ncbi:MAG: hypothetical protein JST59_04550 [Actinobacteria bacterium]|nr:hypothetical protein [Actinomycetota bacterium]
MRSHRFVLAALSAFCLLAAFGATGAGATQVAYVDGGQVWISTLDGASKRSLSGPSPDAKTWTETAQAENGTVIGVRREPGKMGTLNATQLWGPDGATIGYGSLTAKPGRVSYAYPVTLDLTPDGRTVTYGYANWSGFGLETKYEFGTYAEGSSGWYIEPFDIEGRESGTLSGSRVVARSGTSVMIQSPTGQPPYSKEFGTWFSVTGLQRADVSANGKVLAVEIDTGPTDVIAMFPVASLGGAVDEESGCDLPTQGDAGEVSLSADGTTMAWHDDRGVVVAGTPVWFATPEAATCKLSSPPVVISASGKMPSLGNSTAAVPPSTGGGGGGSTGGGTTPAPTSTSPKKTDDKSGGSQGDAPILSPLPKTVKASALSKGLPVTVTVPKAGQVTAVGKVGSQVVAKGTVRAKRAGKVTLRLKATAAWSKRLGQLAGKTLKVTITAPGGTAKLTRMLG